MSFLRGLGGVGFMLTATSATVPDVNVGELTTSISGFLTNNFNTSNLLVIIAAGLGVSVGLVLLWFGFRWVTGKLMGALKKGRL